MKILILGAGRVGASVAENLASEQNDITVVDTDATRLGALSERLDLQTVVGDALKPSVLRRADVDNADLMVACTASDALNLVACRLARTMFSVPLRIARVRSAEYADHPELLGEEGFCVDHLISPERSITQYFRRLIELPEALQVLDFADGRISVVTARAMLGSPLVRHAVGELQELMPDTDVRIVEIFRREKPIPVDARTQIEVDDEVVFVVDSRQARRVVRQFRQAEKSVHRVMIAGGGNIGLRLARKLAADNYSVRLIEYDRTRCELLASELPDNVLVLHGSATDEALLEQEGVADMDTWIAVTADDENNIMSSLLAKRLGARKVITLINRPAYGDLMQGSRIDVALSPAQITLSEILRYVRRGDVVAARRLRRGGPEVLEAVAHGDRRTSSVVGRELSALRLPSGAMIAAVVRDEHIFMADQNPVIEDGDHVIVFVPDRRQIARVEKLFQVSAAFF
ncbi:Trk system potassium transporter TrkA [Alcaligenaceae bacterium SJ-26]|nr:Trk system potassium transporter TrkA [Alcaligenaceae bacterium SJ-26]